MLYQDILRIQTVVMSKMLGLFYRAAWFVLARKGLAPYIYK